LHLYSDLITDIYHLGVFMFRLSHYYEETISSNLGQWYL